jgi:hypothetical protein
MLKLIKNCNSAVAKKPVIPKNNMAETRTTSAK